MSAWVVTMGAGATMGSCIRRWPFHPKEWLGPKSITWASEMAKHNSGVNRSSWDHVQVVKVETDDTQDAIGFGQAPFEYTLKIWNLTAVPRLMVLLSQVSHLHQHFDWCHHIRTRKYFGDRSDNTGIVFVLPV